MAPRMTRRLSASAAVLLITGLLLVGPAAADACAGHVGVRLTEWPTDDRSQFSNSHIDDPPIFYWGVEGAGDTTFTMQVFGHNCTNPNTSVQWATDNGTASAPGDYTDKDGSKALTGFDQDWESHTVSVPIIDDAGTDSSAAEWLKARITGGEANVVSPSEAPIFVVDNDGPDRVTLPDSPYNTVQMSETTAQNPNPDVQIPVFRAGPATEQVVVPYTITPGPGGTAGDYTDMTSGSVTIPAGQWMALLKLAITDDLEDEADEQLTVTISAPSNATVETNTATVTIIDNDVPGGDNTAPETWFHHPRHNQTLKYQSEKAKRIHVFAPDDDPSGIDLVQTAVRKVKKDGSCQWWDGSSWTPDGCADAERHGHWLATKKLFNLSGKILYEHLLKEHLKPSVGTQIKHYFVYSRAEDGAGNMESAIELGRNKNKFEIEKF